MEGKQRGRFLECVEHNLLTQLVREPSGEGILLGLLFVNRGGIMGDVMAGGCLGHNCYGQSFRFSDKQGGALAELLLWISGGQTLAC